MDLILLHVQPRFDGEYIFNDEELARLNMPVFLVGGTRDVIRSIEAMQTRLRPLLPGLHSAILPDTGHVLVNTTDLVLPFLLK